MCERAWIIFIRHKIKLHPTALITAKGILFKSVNLMPGGFAPAFDASVRPIFPKGIKSVIMTQIIIDSIMPEMYIISVGGIDDSLISSAVALTIKVIIMPIQDEMIKAIIMLTSLSFLAI